MSEVFNEKYEKLSGKVEVLEVLKELEKKAGFKTRTFENYLVVHDTKKRVHLDFAVAILDGLNLTDADFDMIRVSIRRFCVDIEKHIERLQMTGGTAE